MNVQDATRLHLPYARHQEYGSPPDLFDGLLVSPPMESPPAIRGRLVPLSRRHSAHATPELA